MALVRRMVANPATSAVSITKHGGKKMATRRREKSSTRRVHPTAANLVRRRRKATTTHSRRRTSGFSRRSNPVIHRRRRHSRRRRNPIGAGVVGSALSFAGASIAVGFVKPIIQRTIGGYLPFAQFNAPIVTAGTGWLVSQAFGFFGPTRRFAQPAMLVGLSAAIIQLISPYISGFLGGAPVNPLMGAPRRRGGMRGIGAWPPVPGMAQWMNPLPPPAAAANSGMHGIGAWAPVPGRGMGY